MRRSPRLEIPEQPGGGKLGHGRAGEVLYQPLQIAFHPRQIRLGNQVLFALVFLEDEEFRDGFRQEFLCHRLAVVGQRELHIKRKRMRPTRQTAEHGLGLVELILRQPGDSSSETGFTL